MGHRTENVARIKYDEELNQFYLEVTATYKEKSATIYRMFEDGKAYSRYVYYRGIAGYLTTFPGEMLDYYYGCGRKQETLDWEECKKPMDIWYRVEWNANDILTHDSQFKYLLKKYKAKDNLNYLLKVMHLYRDHHEVEFLIDAEQYELATNKRLFNLPKAKQKEVLDFVRNNLEYYNMKLAVIQKAIRNNISYQEANDMRVINDYKLYKYLKKQERYDFQRALIEYKDYKKMVEFTGHDLNEDYWRYPTDLHVAIQKVGAEKAIIEEIQTNEQQREKQGAYSKAIEQIKVAKEISGYSVYVPTDIDDIVKQAAVLNQCLVRADYIGKVIDGRSVLCFIKKGEERIGTFEVSREDLKTIIQAYKNERDYGNMNFEPELMQIAKSFTRELRMCHA